MASFSNSNSGAMEGKPADWMGNLQADLQSLGFQDTNNSSSTDGAWIPCDMYCPHIRATPIPKPGAQMAGDRRDWEIRSIGGEWSTITANTGFTTGLHYYEFKISALSSNGMMFGLVYPPDDAHIAVNTLDSYMGRAAAQPVLSKHCLSYNIHRNHCYCKRFHTDAVYGEPLLAACGGNYVGIRIGLLLDLIKFEFRMFYFAAGNITNTPDSEDLLATLHRGRKYYPAFSLYQANTVLQLTTQARPPDSQQRYMDTMAELTARQREYRMRLHEMETRNQTLEQAYVDLRHGYEQLKGILMAAGVTLSE